MSKVNNPKRNLTRRNKRPGRRGRDISYADIGSKVYRDVMPIVNMAKKIFNTENKYLDTIFSAAVSTTASLTILNAMAQGNTASTRIGDTIKFDFMQWNATVQINASAVLTSIRLFIVRDMQPNGAAFGYTSYASTNNDPLTLTNFKQEQRFYTYVDELFCITSNGAQMLTFRGSKALGFHTNYGLSNNGDVTDISANTLYLVLISNEATNTPTVKLDFRLLFVDN